MNFKKVMWKPASVLVLVSAQLLLPQVRADDVIPSGPGYVDLFPAIVTNFGGQGRLRYFKVDVALRLEDDSMGDTVDFHAPHLRSELVELFSRQQEFNLTSREAKEALQEEALTLMQAILEKEEGKPLVTNLLFTNFVIQR